MKYIADFKNRKVKNKALSGFTNKPEKCQHDKWLATELLFVKMHLLQVLICLFGQII